MDRRLKEILLYMPDSLKSTFETVFLRCGNELQEIRLRAYKPLIVSTTFGKFAVLQGGEMSPVISEGHRVSSEDIREFFQLICENSVYAFLEDIRQGFITIKGGHRVGFSGRAVCSDKKIENFKEISSVNIRIAKEVIGAADNFIGEIKKNDKIVNTLIVSPPLMGKTTVLRDIARQISNGGKKVGILDDRGEISAMYKGIPENDVGYETDVIDSAPKKEAAIMMLRSMSPDVIISDEISSEEDASWVEMCFGTGVSVIGSAHGGSFLEVKNRRFIKPLLRKGGFERVILLSLKSSGEKYSLESVTYDTEDNEDEYV